MMDKISLKDIKALTPEAKEKMRKFVNRALAKVECKCTETMRLRGSPNLCPKCEVEYWDAQVCHDMYMLEQAKIRRDAVQPENTSAN